MKRVLIVVGTRPEAIKLAPVYLALRDVPGIDTILLSTGQHKEMIQQIFSFFEIKPDVELDVMSPNQTLARLTSVLVAKLEEQMIGLRPDMVVVQGDTTTAMVGSLAAFYLRIRVAHVEAGLRSYKRDAPFPEEVNRRIVSLVADLHFVPTQSAMANLNEHTEGKVVLTGNTVIDSLLIGRQKVESRADVYFKRFESTVPRTKRIILVTAHRRESFDGGLESIFTAVRHLSERFRDFHFVIPVHLNPNVRQVVFSLLKERDNISLIDPVGYDEMIHLMSRSFLILTDSGGLQEEAPTMNVPVLVMRNVTERPEGVEAGCARLVGTDQQEIISATEQLINDPARYKAMQQAPNPYGDGNASKRIAEIVHKEI